MSARFLSDAAWVLYVTAMDFTTQNETYVFTLEVSDLVAGTYSIMATRAWLGSHGVGKVHVPILGEVASFLNTTSAFMRVTATLGGTSPVVTYGSYLAKDPMGRLGLAARVGDLVTWP